MVISVDINNTNIIMGAMQDGSSAFVSRLTASRERSCDEYAVLLELMAGQNGMSLSGAEGAIISSVVPQLTPVIKEAVRKAAGKVPMILGPGVKTGLNIKINDPGELGGDFVAAAVASEEYGAPRIMLHMGTATALGVIDPGGRYIGGAICPGLLTSMNALAAGTSKLPRVSLEAPSCVIGRDTAESLKSGHLFGTAAMLDGLITRFEDALGARAAVIATGDWAPSVIPLCARRDIVIDEELVLRGLYMIYRKNAR